MIYEIIPLMQIKHIGMQNKHLFYENIFRHFYIEQNKIVYIFFIY